MPRRRRGRTRIRSFLRRLIPTCVRGQPTADSPVEDGPSTSDGGSEVISPDADPSTAMRNAVNILKEYGYGSFGFESKAMIKGKKLTVFEMEQAFQMVTTAKCAYREVYYMSAMDHPNVLGLQGIYYPGPFTPHALCIVTDHTKWDLYSMMERGFIDTGRRSYIMYQLLSALTYLHSRNLIHRDVKPTNILLTSSYMVKLCNFGRARSMSRDIYEGSLLTPRVGCALYQAPELLVGSKCYTKAIDVWAAGAVLMELYTGMPLVGGHQLFEQIVEMMPFVTEDDAVSLYPPNLQAVKNVIANFSLQLGSNCRFEEMISPMPKELQDLSRRMLCFVPQERCTMELAMTHPAFALHHSPEREFTEHSDICPTLSEWRNHSIADFKAEIEKIMVEVNAWVWQEEPQNLQ